MKKALLLIISLSFILIILFSFSDNKGEIKFKLDSETNITVNINDDFIAPKVTASYCKDSDCLDITSFITIENNVDTSKIGNYKITYKAEYKNLEKETDIIVNVIDNIPPTITLKDNSSISLPLNENYKEKGYTAIDNVDGDITDKVTIINKINNKKEGTYDITYSVEDSSGNTTTIKRSVKIYKAKTPENIIVKSSDDLDIYLKNSGYDVSVIYYNINNKYTYKYREKERYYGASLIKTLDALYVYENMEVTDKLRNLVEPTIHKSNNETHKKLVNMIGRNTLRKYGESLGAKHVFDDNRTYDYYGYTDAEDQLIFMKNLWRVVNTNSKGEELKSFFINNYWHKLKFDGAPKIMYKYGWYKYYYHEVGIVLDKSPYIIVILSKEGEKDYSKIIQNISKKVYEFHNSLKK